MNTRCFSLVGLAMLTLSAIFSTATGSAAEREAQLADCVNKGIEYLRKSQENDGSYSPQAGPGITALITTAILRHGRSPDDPLVAKSLKYLESFVQPDGGIYKAGSRIKNYEVCLAMVCFKEANRDGRYDKLLAAANKYITGEQVDEDLGKDASDFDYGGTGYGGKSRPDLSNTQFFLDALQASGETADSEAVKKALVFISRCQNLQSEHNTSPPASKNPDGGFYYTVSAGGVSAAGKEDAGGLRSYGSMTYAGLKSMIFAGVKPSDPRVKAAQEWVRKHYDLKANPGLGDAGLYYYYHTFAKALDALGEKEFVDAEGKTHDWRSELVTELASRQHTSGYWVNDNEKWMEGDPRMVTGFALLALSYCK